MVLRYKNGNFNLFFILLIFILTLENIESMKTSIQILGESLYATKQEYEGKLRNMRQHLTSHHYLMTEIRHLLKSLAKVMLIMYTILFVYLLLSVMYVRCENVRPADVEGMFIDRKYIPIYIKYTI